VTGTAPPPDRRARSVPYAARTRLPVEVVRSRRRRKTVQAREVDGRLRVLIPSWMSPAEEARWVGEMQRRLAHRRRVPDDAALGRRAALVARRHGLPSPSSIRWSGRQGRRWGSCSVDTGVIRISTRLAAAPLWVLDYVLIHELAHLVVAAHDHRFYALVDAYQWAERAEGFLDAWGLAADGPTPAGTVVGVEHVQLPMGPGGRAAADRFYAGLLGLRPHPDPLSRGVRRFDSDGVRLDLVTSADGRSARTTLAVVGLAALVDRLRFAGHPVRHREWSFRAETVDPFGNRIELVERGGRIRTRG